MKILPLEYLNVKYYTPKHFKGSTYFLEGVLICYYISTGVVVFFPVNNYRGVLFPGEYLITVTPVKRSCYLPA